MIEIVVPGAPVPKGRPRFTSQGGFARTFTPKATAEYERKVAGIARSVMIGKQILTCPVKVDITAFMPIPVSMPKYKKEMAVKQALLPAKKPDIDNLAKAALDALNGICFADDNLICALNLRKVYAENSRLEIQIEKIKEAENEIIG